MNYTIEAVCVSSLERIYPDQRPQHLVAGGSMLKNELYSFQVAYNCAAKEEAMWNRAMVSVRVDGGLQDNITIREVGLVPSNLPVYSSIDDDYERTLPGLFPDPLYSMPENGLPVRDLAGWRSIWITVDPKDGIVNPGKYDLSIRFIDIESNTEVTSVEYKLNVIDALLPKQELKYTCWFYLDCIADYYNIEMYSPLFWHRTEQFIQAAVKHGMNTILTPIITPPLETAYGTERPTVQLVDIYIENDNYTFAFDKLVKFIELSRSNGIEYFEITHLFSQWGCKYAPKVMAEVNGEYKRIFGWETDAGSSEYVSFLKQLLSALKECLKELGIEDKCLYHVSDEPSYGQRMEYKHGRDLITEVLGDVPVIDAMSEFGLYSEGYVTTPVPSIDCIQPFIDAGVENLWGYYCCSQTKEVSNRFFSMPSSRNRIIGLQLYKYQLEGFLHWGYNFYYSQQSLEKINPFLVTDGRLAYPSGDAFCVYPGEDGPIESLRLLVFYEGITDLRACKLLEELKGRDYVISLIENQAGAPITFAQYPKGQQFILTLRQKINEEIESALASKAQ